MKMKPDETDPEEGTHRHINDNCSVSSVCFVLRLSPLLRSKRKKKAQKRASAAREEPLLTKMGSGGEEAAAEYCHIRMTG